VGLEAKRFMDRGELVPDRVVVELVARHLSGPEPLPGFVLDGFPRTLPQAKTAYDWGRAHDRTFQGVISLDVPEDELVRRLLERGKRSGRSDDTEATIRNRLTVYAESTRPLLDFYRERGVLHEIDGTGEVDEVTTRIREILDPLLASG
jgi:adenylate kinase